jgi:hypothetical protein
VALPQGTPSAGSHEAAATRQHDSGGQQEPSPGEERTWQRVTLAPGVELHYEPHTAGIAGGAVRRLIEAARTILGSHPEKGTEEK